MKARKLSASLVLLSVVNIPIFADEMDCPVISPQPRPQPASMVESVTAAVDPLLEVAL